MATEDGRDRIVDVLRFVAIVCIVVAHTTPNELLFRIRNFDVVLMVFLNGISFYISQNNKRLNYKNYINKRFNRLILSTWIFLFLFFSLFFVTSFLLRVDYVFSIKTIIASFSLIGGIGYVWIMYVFFIVALISPLILTISQKIIKHKYYFAILIIAYIIYELLISASALFPASLSHISEMYILNPIGYCIVTAVGIRFKELDKKTALKGISILLLIFLSFLYLKDYQSTQNFKYPPTIYYLSYGLFASFTLYMLLTNTLLQKLFFNRFVFLFSKNSLDIYFFHIISLYVLEIYGGNLDFIQNYFLTRFFFIMCTAMLFTYLFEIVKKLLKNAIIKRSTIKESSSVNL